MKKYIIEMPEPGDERNCFDLVDEQGRRCDGLCLGELLEQIVLFAVQHIPLDRIGTGYPMRTPEEWAQQRGGVRP